MLVEKREGELCGSFCHKHWVLKYSVRIAKYQRLYLRQNENCRDGRKPLGGMCGRRTGGRRGQLGLVKKCRD